PTGSRCSSKPSPPGDDAKRSPTLTNRRKAKEATPSYLEGVALWYLGRYTGSRNRLERALKKRVDRSVRELGTDREQGLRALEEVVAKMERLGYVDDARLAVSRVDTLRGRGASRRKIVANLRGLGLSSEVIDAALAAETDADAERKSAETFARKKRIGPFRRDAETRRPNRQKDLARLARAGFNYDVALELLDRELDDEATEP
ncbi:MAG: regulatory protein RecX, partial [Myxococcota bacterium]